MAHLRYMDYVSELPLITHEPTEYESPTISPVASYQQTKSSVMQSDEYITIYVVISAVILIAILIYVKHKDPRPCI